MCETKTCSRCGEVKALDAFHVDKNNMSGFRASCKACTNATKDAYRAAHKEQIKVASSAYYAANQDREKAKSAAYYAANKEKMKANGVGYLSVNKERIRAKRAAYRAANKAQIKARTDAWNAANPEGKKAANAAWYSANHEAARIHGQNRRARKLSSGGSLSKGLSAKLFKLQKGKCPCCKQPLGDDYHLDHITPLARGGSHTDGNMQLLRSTCNQQKHAKHPVDFMQERGFLL